MENRQTVMIELDKPRRLRYTLNEFALIKERLGLNLFDAGEAEIDQAMRDPAKIRMMVFLGLAAEDKDLTEDAVGGMIDLGNLGYVGEKFAEALAASQQGALRPPKGRQRTQTP